MFFFVFPDPKMGGGIPSPAPSHTLGSGGGGGGCVYAIYVYIYMAYESSAPPPLSAPPPRVHSVYRPQTAHHLYAGKRWQRTVLGEGAFGPLPKYWHFASTTCRQRLQLAGRVYLLCTVSIDPRPPSPCVRVNDGSGPFWGKGAFGPLPKYWHFASTTYRQRLQLAGRIYLWCTVSTDPRPPGVCTALCGRQCLQTTDRNSYDPRVHGRGIRVNGVAFSVKCAYSCILGAFGPRPGTTRPPRGVLRTPRGGGGKALIYHIYIYVYIYIYIYMYIYTYMYICICI